MLTVCIGNICRSPLAERLLRLRLAEHVAAGHLLVDSAGVGAVVGHGVDALADEQLTRLGGSGEGFAARQISRQVVEQSDLILTATTDVRARALREDPRALKRMFTLGEFASVCANAEDLSITSPSALVAYAATHRPVGTGAELDVLDPIGADEATHRAVADQIDGYVTAIAARLGPRLAAPGSLDSPA